MKKLLKHLKRFFDEATFTDVLEVFAAYVLFCFVSGFLQALIDDIIFRG